MDIELNLPGIERDKIIAMNFGQFLRMASPSLWRRIESGGIANGAVFEWKHRYLARWKFWGFNDPLWVDGFSSLEVVGVASRGMNNSAWRGVPSKLVRDEGGVTVFGADESGLAARLNRARAKFVGESIPPRPGSPEGRIYHRILMEDAAEKGDISEMDRIRFFGIDDADYYRRALWLAGKRGDVAFVRALIGEIGLSIGWEDFCACEAGEDASADDREFICTLLLAGFTCPNEYRPVIARWAEKDPRLTACLV